MASLRISVLFLLSMLIMGLTACGKTGPLYLPEQPASPEQPQSVEQ